MTSVDPNMVRALVRQALEQKLGLRPTPRPVGPARAARQGGPTRLSVHPSQFAISDGPESYEDMDLPLQKPCLIEPHRPCYNSGYCKKLGH